MNLEQLELQATLDTACHKHLVPGASAALFAGGQLCLAAYGIANASTGIAMTVDTLMHIGSITKILNATLLMQLVDEGRVVLDHPVVDYLPEFRVGDAVATRAITVEMLVNHTSGIDGDLLPDAGHDKETIEATIERFSDLKQIHAPGHGRSYCNPGTVVAGYLAQRLLRKSWYDLIKERLFEPLGMQHASVTPEDSLLHRTSVGHFLNRATNELNRTSHVFLPLGYAPAGSTAMMSASDLMTFAIMHLADGIAPNGLRILWNASSARMRQRSGPIDGPQAFENGLGWRLSGDFVLHAGGGPGIVSFLIAHPKSQTAAVVLTNAEHGFAVIAEVIGPFLKTHLRIDAFPPLPQPTGEQVDAARYVGVYRSINTIHEVEAHAGRLTWASYSTQKYYDSSPMEKPEPTPLIPVGNDRFLADSRASTMAFSDTALVWFAEPNANGQMSYLAENLWLFPRVVN